MCRSAYHLLDPATQSQPRIFDQFEARDRTMGGFRSAANRSFGQPAAAGAARGRTALQGRELPADPLQGERVNTPVAVRSRRSSGDSRKETGTLRMDSARQTGSPQWNERHEPPHLAEPGSRRDPRPGRGSTSRSQSSRRDRVLPLAVHLSRFPYAASSIIRTFWSTTRSMRAPTARRRSSTRS